jgi:hypothetical protein
MVKDLSQYSLSGKTVLGKSQLVFINGEEIPYFDNIDQFLNVAQYYII